MIYLNDYPFLFWNYDIFRYGIVVVSINVYNIISIVGLIWEICRREEEEGEGEEEEEEGAFCKRCCGAKWE